MIVRVLVYAGAKKEKFEREESGRFLAFVREEPVRNQANRRVVELVAREFGVPAADVAILTGHRSPQKTLRVGRE